MNKKEIVAIIAKDDGITQQEAHRRVDRIFELITKQLVENSKVKIRGFGTFKTTSRNEKIIKNPNTGVMTKIPSHISPIFTPSKMLKDRVRAGESNA